MSMTENTNDDVDARPVYLTANITINDRERYRDYEAGFTEIFMKYEGRAVAVDDSATTLEGEKSWTRHVILKFPSRAAAMAWYESPEYQALAAIRFEASDASVFLIRGLG